PPATLEFIQPFRKIVGYQGFVNKVSALFTKNLVQPWQEMFKVFNRCLASRMFGHDQIKINILQIFHAVINKVHVDYANLLWWDFLHCVQQKKNVIQYPRFTKLFIDDIMEKYKLNPKRIKEDYHSIKDDTLLKNKRKGTPASRETSSPRKSLKIQFKKQKPSTTTPPPPSDDREQKMVDEDEESTANEFADTVLLDEEDSDDRLEPGSHKKKPENINDDDDVEKKYDKKDDDHDYTDQALIGTRMTGSSEIRTEKMQTPILSPPRSPRKDLSSDKAIDQELTAYVSPTPATSTQDSSKPTSSKCKILLGSIAKMSRRRSHLRKHMNKTFIINCYFQDKREEMNETLHNKVPELTVSTTDDLIKEALLRMVNDAVKQDRESSQAIVPALISQDFDAHAPKLIEELFRIHMQNTVLNVHPKTSAFTTTTTFDLQRKLYLKMKTNLQA
nr:hypothetical protein [Tanacetum cinerariifolium]